VEPGSTGQLLFALVLVVFGAFFSLSEMSLTTISKLTVRQMKEDGLKRARTVEKLVENKDRLISSVLLGNNLTAILTSAIVTAFALYRASEENEALAITIATIVTTLVIVVFGDIIPKIVASKHPRKSALFVARPMSFMMVVFSPISAVLNGFINKIFSLFGAKNPEEDVAQKEQEFMTFLDMSLEEGVISEEEGKMIDAVFEFQDAAATDIMTPRVDIAGIELNDSYDEVLEIFKTEKFSRLPVYDESIDNIVGIMTFRDFMLMETPAAEFKPANLMTEPFFSYEHITAAKLFSQMKARAVNIAIISDEYGGTSGLLTIEDLVETIVGDILDEADHEDMKVMDEDIVCIAEGKEYVVQGSVRIEDFNELLGLELFSEDSDTMGGYVTELFDYIPSQGESIIGGEMTFTVESVDRNRIVSINIKIDKTAVAEKEIDHA